MSEATPDPTQAEREATRPLTLMERSLVHLASESSEPGERNAEAMVRTLYSETHAAGRAEGEARIAALEEALGGIAVLAGTHWDRKGTLQAAIDLICHDARALIPKASEGSG